jgi:hypothetical protein
MENLVGQGFRPGYLWFLITDNDNPSAVNYLPARLSELPSTLISDKQTPCVHGHGLYLFTNFITAYMESVYPIKKFIPHNSFLL